MSERRPDHCGESVLGIDESEGEMSMEGGDHLCILSLGYLGWQYDITLDRLCDSRCTGRRPD